MYAHDDKVKMAFEQVKGDMETLQLEVIRLKEENKQLKHNFNEWVVFLNKRMNFIEENRQQKVMERLVQ